MQSDNQSPNSIDLADIQGNVLRGYRKNTVRHIVLEVTDAAPARRWLKAIVEGDTSGVPRITDAAHWGEQPPEVCFNVSLTYPGLVAMGVPENTTSSFPTPFKEGMAARAFKIGDWDESGPDHWQPWFQPDAPAHVVVSLHSNNDASITQFEQAMMAGGAGHGFRILGFNSGANFNGDEVHFGYRDNISQPRFAGISPKERYSDQPNAPLGTVLLGHPTAFEELTWTIPDPAVLGRNGTFNAYRILEQDVVAFEDFLERAARTVLADPSADELLPQGTENRFGAGTTRESAMKEVVAAKLLGRWRTGTPLALSPHDPSPEPPVSDTDFDYADDIEGLRCPFSSHTRRANPRGAKIVQTVANHTRRLVRRGMPYGPKFDPSNPTTAERGLLGNFLCANLAAQFEAVQYDWVNLGLQDPRITGSNDPVLGANDERSSWFDLPTSRGSIRLRGFPRFIRARGGAYTFIPSLRALRWLGSL